MKRLRFFLIAMIALGPALALAQQSTLREEVIYRVTLGKPKDVKLLIKRIGTPNMTDDLGYPLLYIAASRTDPAAFDIVEALVDVGADVNYHGGRQHYPLMAAVQSGNPKIVNFLLEKGANYRAVDAYGVKVVDFARQGTSRDVQKLIEDRVQKDIEGLAMARNQENLDKLTYDLAYHACAMQYFSYYYKSGQDDIPQAEQDATTKKHKDVVQNSISQLVSLFRAPQDEINQVFHTARGRMFNELELLISNRWRRQKGIGKPGDMEKRCLIHVEEFKDDVFDKAELDKKIHF